MKYLNNKLLDNKKYYVLVYFIFIIIFSASFFNLNNYSNFNFELCILLVLLMAGIFILLYFTEIELYKSCFIIILIFGLVMTFTTPILIVCDEGEHFARSELTSQGILNPEYVNNGYKVTHLFDQLFNNSGGTLTTTNLVNEKIDSSSSFYGSCFAHNPFYAYLISAFGIFLAKLFNLGVMWAMWLGRFLNLLFYAVVCSYAVKKAPIYKIPLFIVACIPLSIYQAASFSADCFIISVSIFSIAQFIYLYKSSKVNVKDLSVFFICVLLISLFKFPYVLFGFFIFFINKDKFDSKNIFLLSRIVPFILIGICLVYTSYASGLLLNSIRRDYFLANNINPSSQFNNLLNNPLDTVLLFTSSFSFIVEMIFDLFRFSHASWTYESSLLSILFLIFFSIISIIYDEDHSSFKMKDRLFFLIIIFLIYIGIIIIQYLSWAPVGYGRLDMGIGVYSRYYIPLLALFPIVFKSGRLSSITNINNYDMKVTLCTIIFLAGSIIFTVATFY